MIVNYSDVMQVIASVVAQASKKIAVDFDLAFTSARVLHKNNKSNLPDFVTNTDIEAQKIIQDMLKIDFPEIEFVGEEGDKRAVLPQSYFLVDPLDGTSNFVALRDYFACSAAYVESGEVKAAVIADPIKGLLVKAYRNGGCFRTTIDEPLENQEVLPLNEENVSLKQVQLECELAMNNSSDFELLGALLPSMSGLRKSGSSALDMAHIALGRKIALVSKGLEPHDIAAGLLIVREAGGLVTDFKGADATVTTRDIFAGSPSIHQKVIGLTHNIVRRIIEC